jgi:NAD+ kinase
MMIGIYGSGTTEFAVKMIKKILDDADISSFSITKSTSKQADCVIVLGGDKGVRNYFHRTFDSTLPILGISEGESSGFLAQIDLKEFASYVNVLKKQKYTIEEVPRLGGTITVMELLCQLRLVHLHIRCQLVVPFYFRILLCLK